MKHYVPFLKMKQNEIGAIKALASTVASGITPFFDIPRPKESTEQEISERLRIAKKNADLHLKKMQFYVDNFDIDDTLPFAGRADQYGAILDLFSSHNIIPVAALNRSPAHNISAIKHGSTRNILAIRLTPEDIESYRITKPYLFQVYSEILANKINRVDLIIDARVINSNATDLAVKILRFLESFEKDFFASRIIFTGSSIPASVRDVLSTKDSGLLQRKEWDAWEAIKSTPTSTARMLIFGDYGVVSPDYTDMEMDFAVIQNVAAPKAFYTFNNQYFVVRGGAFKTHPEKYGQYYSMADLIASQKFFRATTYSYGEEYIADRSSLAIKKASKSGSPGSWLKATLASHLTYIFDSL